MANFKITTAKDFIRKPWKNGGGMTEELLVFPDSGEFLWRMSVASIDRSGPFSLFKGYSRILIPLEGSIQVTHQGWEPKDLPVMQPYKFEGDWQTDCKLQSKRARDFNVIFKTGEVRAQVQVIVAGEKRSLPAGSGRVFVYSVTGNTVLRSPMQTLPEHTLVEVLMANDQSRTEIQQGQGSSIVVHIAPV
jgi:uncharacterized protein